jgi:hypothetical protein
MSSAPSIEWQAANVNDSNPWRRLATLVDRGDGGAWVRDLGRASMARLSP